MTCGIRDYLMYARIAAVYLKLKNQVQWAVIAGVLEALVIMKPRSL